MADVSLALLWHQHQPYYPDDVAGENPMPWVRLHGVKDYWGMAQHLLEVPEMRCTINLVPSLIKQILRYTDHGGSDRFLDLSRVPADGLSEADAAFLLDNFFMIGVEHNIKPWLGYWELYQRRQPTRTRSISRLSQFGVRRLRDLQVWFNLAWLHPLAFEYDANLEELRKKGRDFTEADKDYVLAKHLELLRQIIPLHRRLQECGQVELTTTPFFHPILPLLLDKRLTKEGEPEVALPRHLDGYPEDVAWHLRAAQEFHTQHFGAPARGLWPSEGSVAQALLPFIAEAGFKWLATDEEILGQATAGLVGRDERGHVRNPQTLYQPCSVSEGGHELGIVFRDHALSDLIGFQYQHMDGRHAAADMVARLRAIGSSIDGPGPALVSVILDGENCWEHYPGGGVEFLRTLYRRVAMLPEIRPVRIHDFLEKHPPKLRLNRLPAGSWINHNFAIWIGHSEDNTAWDRLDETREHLKRRAADVPAEAAQRAWEELYIAEGSDWWWWYGPQHSSAQDELFDYLFRKHLMNVYYLVGTTPPALLSQPIKKVVVRAPYSQPRSFLDVQLDGKRRPVAWLGAGVYQPGNERGTMAMVARGPLVAVHFGFTPELLLVRVDLAGPARTVLAPEDCVAVVFQEPAGYQAVIRHPGTADQVAMWHTPHGEAPAPGLQAGGDQGVAMG
ncbi:MAG TPA: glycoside hydrolase family 57 protein, partial [Gemmatales bacterium]|nr:glycoside hydrolase family 57 protein [Gemmatales bacterium]